MRPLQRVLTAVATVGGFVVLAWVVATRSSPPQEAVEPAPPRAEPGPTGSGASGAQVADSEAAEVQPVVREEPESEAQRAQRLAAEALKAECSYWSAALERRESEVREAPADIERLQLLARDCVIALLFSEGRYEQRELGRTYPTPPRSVGHEIQVAGRFGPQAFLVRPAEFPEYWDVLDWLQRPEAEQRDVEREPERLELGARIEALALLAREALAARAKEL